MTGWDDDLNGLLSMKLRRTALVGRVPCITLKAQGQAQVLP